MKAPQGYILQAFEKREGRTVLSWLAEHGAEMTATQAAAFVGYVAQTGIRDLAARHMPGFKFRKRAPLFSRPELASALARNEAGEPWRDIALEYRRDVAKLKDRCLRYRRLVRDKVKVAA